MTKFHVAVKVTQPDPEEIPTAVEPLGICSKAQPLIQKIRQGFYGSGNIHVYRINLFGDGDSIEFAWSNSQRHQAEADAMMGSIRDTLGDVCVRWED